MSIKGNAENASKLKGGLGDSHSLTGSTKSKAELNGVVSSSQRMAGHANKVSVIHGLTPYIKDGNWWIGEVDTGVRAEGIDGKDGKDGVDFKVGNGLELTEDDVLNVITTDEATSGSNTPITSGGVYTIVGNIDILLNTI